MMPTTPVKKVETVPLVVGVAGVGNWGVEHLRAWQSLPAVEVAAVCDRDPHRLGAVQEKYKVARGYTGVGEMLRDVRLDAASIVTREEDRLEIASAFLGSGVHVLVEKPLALNLDDAAQMLRRAENAGLVLMPGHVLRFDTSFAVLKERIANGALGAVRSIYASRLMPRAQYESYASNHLALMAAIHDFDIARWYFGSEPITVQTWPGFPPGGNMPDHLWSMLHFGVARVAIIEAGWVLPSGHGAWLESETRVIGQDGVAEIRQPADSLSISRGEGKERVDTATAPHAFETSMGALREEIRYFAQCVLTGELPTRVSARDGLESLRVALAVARAGETGNLERV
jgi:UDP-N-acetylglucosamine 3-dehydrogenase